MSRTMSEMSMTESFFKTPNLNSSKNNIFIRFSPMFQYLRKQLQKRRGARQPLKLLTAS
jgi:hypothetical protein